MASRYGAQSKEGVRSQSTSASVAWHNEGEEKTASAASTPERNVGAARSALRSSLRRGNQDRSGGGGNGEDIISDESSKVRGRW